MTDTELCRSFLQAKSRKHQIGVLSDLTQRSKDEVRAVLEAHGIDPSEPAPKQKKIEIGIGGDGKLLPKPILQEVIRYAFYRRRKR